MALQIILAVISLIVAPVCFGFVKYYVGQVQKAVERLEREQADHEKKDDERFEKLAVRIDAVKGNELLYEKLDTLKNDITEKRHAFRNEMHIMIAEIEQRMERELRRVEGKVK